MKITILTITVVFAAMFMPAASAGSDPVFTGWRDNNAVGGYDVTSFYAGLPLKGKPEFSVQHEGARWMFTTRTNLDVFTEDPDRFAPAYGGYCAWAVANDKLAKGSPKHWNVEDGRLYLNFNGRIKKRWSQDKARFIQEADANWPAILED